MIYTLESGIEIVDTFRDLTNNYAVNDVAYSTGPGRIGKYTFDTPVNRSILSIPIDTITCKKTMKNHC